MAVTPFKKLPKLCLCIMGQQGAEIPNALYIGNLPPGIGNEDLRDEFQNFGRITDIEVWLMVQHLLQI